MTPAVLRKCIKDTEAARLDGLPHDYLILELLMTLLQHEADKEDRVVGRGYK